MRRATQLRPLKRASNRIKMVSSSAVHSPPINRQAAKFLQNAMSQKKSPMKFHRARRLLPRLRFSHLDSKLSGELITTSSA